MSVKHAGIIANIGFGSQKFSKISQQNLWNYILPLSIPLFLEKLESWLDRLNMPLSNYLVSFVGFSNSLHDYLLYKSFWEHNSSLWTYSVAVLHGL